MATAEPQGASTPPPVLLVGFPGALSRRLTEQTAAVGAEAALARDAAGAEATLASVPVALVVVGPGVAPEDGGALAEAALEMDHPPLFVVLAAGDELGRFQPLLDADRLHFLTRSTPDDAGVQSLLATALLRILP
ncbi:MAG: hypothetical protein AAGD06_30030, partial [Acidobacteriota bacterium]